MSRHLFGALRDGLKSIVKDEVDDYTQKKLGLPPPIPDSTRNETTTEDYEYSLLTGGTLALRLIELLPGTRQDDIACRLYETTLDECVGAYEALSYVWGKVEEKTPIQINDRTLQIGPNLRLALLNLRNVDAPRVLWIDAICVNQNDTNERSRQVAIMGDIYRRAARTVVWLCDRIEEERATERAIDLVKKLANEAIGQSESTNGMLHLANIPEPNTVKMTHQPGDDSWYQFDEILAHVLQSDWWFRAWTTQEILLASKGLVMIGPYSIDWDTLCLGGNHGINAGLWANIPLGALYSSVATPYLSLQMMEKVYRGNATDTTPAEMTPAAFLLEMLIQSQFRAATDPRDKVYSLLGIVPNPTDLDTLAAEQPLKPSLPLGIWPNYEVPVSSVYAQVACQMMLETGNLDVLGTCRAADPEQLRFEYFEDKPLVVNSSADLVLPRWVPDWSKTGHTVIPLLHDARGQPRTTNATAHSIARPQFLEKDADGVPKILLLHAYEVTTLVDLSVPLRQLHDVDSENLVVPDAPDSSTARIVLWGLGLMFRMLASTYDELMSIVPHLATYDKWETFAKKEPPTNPRPPRATAQTGAATSAEEEPEDALAVYWQTLCIGTYPDEAEVSAMALSVRGRKIAAQQMFYSWRASLKPIRDLNRWHMESKLRPVAFLGYIRKTWEMFGDFIRFNQGCFGRRLARGANGYLCMVPATAEKGDVLILAQGGRVPLVVRPPSENEGEEAGCWQFVGEAYVQGIMDGEVWDETKCQEFKIC